MSQQWTPVNSSRTDQQQQQTKRKSLQDTPTSARKKYPNDPIKNKKANEDYKARKFKQVIEKWGPAGLNLAKEYLIHHPQRLHGRRIDETTESEWPSMLPHDWTYKLYRVANALPNYERSLEYIRYQVYQSHGSKKCPTTFPSALILDKVYDMINSGSKPKQITEHQLKEKGLRIAKFGLLELDAEGEREEEDEGNDKRDNSRSLRSQSAISNQSRDRSSSRRASEAATDLVNLMTDYISDRERIENKSDDSRENSNKDSSGESTAKPVKVTTEDLDETSDDSSESFSPDDSVQSHDSVDTESTSPSVFTEKTATSLHITKGSSGIPLLDSLHPETITMIGKYLSMKDCMSLSLTNHRCRSAVRPLLLQDFLTLAIDDGDISRIRKLLKDGAIVHMDISDKDNCLDHPLVRAAARGQLRITQAFLNELQQEHHGVSFEKRQKLETAAFVTACGKGAEELVDYFLLMRQDTVDVNCVFNEKTALSTAVACNQAEVVELLLESGACATREDLEMAHRAGFADVAAPILCKYPNLLCSHDVQFLHELHACIDEEIDETKEELKEYMRAHDLGTIV